jgi:spore coat protein CotH
VRRSSSSSSGNVTNRIGLILEETDETSSFKFNSSSSTGSSRERFTTKPQTNEIYYVYPEPDEITAAQRAYLAGYLNKFETTLNGKNFADKTNGYPGYIDARSFIDHHIIVEMSKNVDGYRFSTFFHKDRGGKIRMGPVWDWNLSFGNANGKQGWMPEYWLWPQLTDKEYSWFRRLFQDPDFGQQYVDRWAQLRTNVLLTSRIFNWIDQTTNLLNEAQIRNYEKWPILGRQVWPQYTWGDTYADEVKFMKDWITNRFAWMDAQFLAAPRIQSTNSQRVIIAPKGEVYYTVDGTDPRQSGGKPAPAALKYSTPSTIADKTRLFARAYDGKHWSAPLRADL